MDLTQFPGKPGKYRFKISSWTPTLTVNVFKNSLNQNDGWRLRCGALIMNPERFLNQKSWEGPINY